MGILLAVLVLTALGIGFIGLMVLPLFFVWLAVCIFKEPWQQPASAQVPAQLAPEPVAEQPKPVEVERPRAMAAGQRRPR